MRIVVLAAALIAGGCAMIGPDYQRPASDLPANFGEPDAGAAAIAIAPQWWNLYGDRALDELVSAGLERNADVRLAVARLEEAEAALREAHATIYFPLIEGTGGATRSRASVSGARRVAHHVTLGL